ncbi:MAG: AlkA N-terminal domain-containing protein [Pseudomonadota bacterium]
MSANHTGLTRASLARALLRDCAAPLQAVARAAGFSSAVAMRSELGADAVAPGVRRGAELELTLPLGRGVDSGWLLDFLQRRSLPGLEEVTDGGYRRLLGAHWLSVRPRGARLRISLPVAAAGEFADAVARVHHVFDLDANCRRIDAALAQDDWLAAELSYGGGVRVPGAFDGFETAVRAILGQQVSVARARNLAIALIERFGAPGRFPQPTQLADADVSAIGMPGKRGEAVRALARAALEGAVTLSPGVDSDALSDGLCALPGIGPWTAGYVSMRVAGDANAFPRGDWVVLKVLDMTAAKAEARSQAWAPWRAYALMYIWRRAGRERESK